MARLTTAKEGFVRVRLPLIPGAEKQEAVYASCNGKDYVIPRGVEMEIPDCIAEILQHADEAMLTAYARQSKFATA